MMALLIACDHAEAANPSLLPSPALLQTIGTPALLQATLSDSAAPAGVEQPPRGRARSSEMRSHGLGTLQRPGCVAGDPFPTDRGHPTAGVTQGRGGCHQ